MLNIFNTDSNEQLHKELLKDYLNEDKIQKLIDSGVNINKKDAKGRTLLYELVRKKRIESIKILIKNGIDINSEDSYGKTVLNEAVERADNMMIRFLLGQGASVDFINSSGRTILQDMALEGNTKVFKTLMAYNPDLDYVDTYGRTVLFDAVEGGSLEIVKEVLLNIDDGNITDRHGRSILFYAAIKDDPAILNFLIDYGLDINLTDAKRQNILFTLVLFGADRIDVIEKLIERDIKLNIKDSSDHTILDEILHILSLIRDPKAKRARRYNVIHQKRNYLKLTTLLIEHGLAVNRRDEQGKTVLYREVKRKNYVTIKFLVTSGADINAEDNEGKTVLFDACLEGLSNLKMIDFLMELGADLDHRDLMGRSVVDDLVEVILIKKNRKRPSSRRFLEAKDNEDYMGLLKRILLQRPKINTPRENGRTVIFEAIVYNNLELLKQLLNNGADPNVMDNEGNTPLSVLIDDGLKIARIREREHFLERIVFILKYRVDVDMVDKDGRTIYHKAVIANDLEVVEKLLTKKANLNIKDKQGRTALHHTQWKGNYKIARLLIVAGANMDEPDYAGFTILNYAAILGHAKLVVILIASGVLMYNHNKKSKAVAKFFKEKEKNLDRLLEGPVTDEKMRKALCEVIQNLKKEIDDALK